MERVFQTVRTPLQQTSRASVLASIQARITHDSSCDSVAESLGCRTCDQQVAGSNPDHRAAECNPGQVVYTHVPLSSSSIIWYRPVGGDTRRLGGG